MFFRSQSRDNGGGGEEDGYSKELDFEVLEDEDDLKENILDFGTLGENFTNHALQVFEASGLSGWQIREHLDSKVLLSLAPTRQFGL